MPSTRFKKLFAPDELVVDGLLNREVVVDFRWT